MAIHNNIQVKFNVGGKIFETITSTLAKAGHNSFFRKMFDKNWNLQTYDSADDDGNYFIDRNPDCFTVLLDLLRTGQLYIPSNIPEKLLHRDALFYGLLDNVRSAKCGQFDGNRLRFSPSVTAKHPVMAPPSEAALTVAAV
ncbi:BTB/POZ domain-containing protein [Camellia lanceoleosa]|uniref:BTB/POZ domain-containing protein n=1 Tax=Camellia lanceoleosa TaxID=1840588 RepID=A0ACC0HYK7_9ERIC|nr:BTB/POZ domain-containing protein [Camellia lanceoleosa]